MSTNSRRKSKRKRNTKKLLCECGAPAVTVDENGEPLCEYCFNELYPLHFEEFNE